jgi:hypothetical protein
MDGDLLGGARLLKMKPTLGYSITGDLGPIVLPGRNGSKQVNESIWDGIIGVKGRYAFGDDNKWFVPFYLDVGTGQSQLTWQISGGSAIPSLGVRSSRRGDISTTIPVGKAAGKHQHEWTGARGSVPMVSVAAHSDRRAFGKPA